MDNNNLFGQENQNGEQGQYQQPYQQGQSYQQQQYQQPYQQQVYQQPYQQPYQGDNNGVEEPVSFGDWMLTILIMCIPCVNIVMMFVWAFGSSTKKSKSNFFKATLVWYLIVIVLTIISIVAFGVSLASIFNSGTYY